MNSIARSRDCGEKRAGRCLERNPEYDVVVYAHALQHDVCAVHAHDSVMPLRTSTPVKENLSAPATVNASCPAPSITALPTPVRESPSVDTTTGPVQIPVKLIASPEDALATTSASDRLLQSSGGLSANAVVAPAMMRRTAQMFVKTAFSLPVESRNVPASRRRTKSIHRHQRSFQRTAGSKTNSCPMRTDGKLLPLTFDNVVGVRIPDQQPRRQIVGASGRVNLNNVLVAIYEIESSRDDEDRADHRDR